MTKLSSKFIPITINCGNALAIDVKTVVTIVSAELINDGKFCATPPTSEPIISTPACTINGSIVAIVFASLLINSVPLVINCGNCDVIPCTNLLITCGPFVVTVCSIESISAPNWLLTKPNPATTKPKIAAGPTAAKANLTIAPIAVVMPPKAPIPTPEAVAKPPPIPGMREIRPPMLLDTIPNAALIGPVKIPANPENPIIKPVTAGNAPVNANPAPKVANNGIIGSIVF